MISGKPVTKSGILVIDKPEGMSSAQVVARVKKITGAKKVGHTGTLDPFATGIMICGINSGTRISRFFLKSDKTYEAGIQLGIETDTLDRTGEVTATCEDNFFQKHSDIFSGSNFEKLLKEFEGKQQQLPPVYSALKHKGVPLYKLARQGKPVQKPARSVEIYNITLNELSAPRVKFTVSCSSGTYIRTLSSDIGKKTGCGAHLFSLRRTETSGFTIHDAITLDDLEKLSDCSEKIISMSDALPEIPGFIADDKLSKRISHGMELTLKDRLPFTEPENPFIKILNTDNQLIAIVEFDKNKGKYNYCCVFHN